MNCIYISTDSTVGTFSSDWDTLAEYNVPSYGTGSPDEPRCSVCGELESDSTAGFAYKPPRCLECDMMAVAVLPTGSHKPNFTDRCNVVRAQSYARQQARNERFEHLRRLLCKPEPVKAPTEWLPDCSWVVTPKSGIGPVWTMGDTPDSFTVRERERTSEVSTHVDFSDMAYLEAYDYDETDVLVIDHDEEWHNERSFFVNGDAVLAEEQDYAKWHDIRLRDLAAGFQIQRREKGQITVNLKSRWVTYTSSQAKCRITANTTTGRLSMKFGALELFKEKVAVKDIISKRDAWAVRAEKWLRENGHEPNVAIATTQHTSDPLKATAALRDKLYLSGVQVNVKIMGR